MRVLFQAIVDLVQTIPVGPQSPQGELRTPSVSVTGAVVDGASTMSPWGSPPARARSSMARMSIFFGIPRGNDRMHRPQGNPGNNGGRGPQGNLGQQGDPGPQGPPLTNFVVDRASTLDPWQPAWGPEDFRRNVGAVQLRHPVRQRRPARPARQQRLRRPTGTTRSALTNFTVDAEHAPALGERLRASELRRHLRPIHLRHPAPAGWHARPPRPTGPGRPALHELHRRRHEHPPALGMRLRHHSVRRHLRPFPFRHPARAGRHDRPQTSGRQGDLRTTRRRHSDTAANTNAIATLEIPIINPPVQSELEQVLGEVNELIVDLRWPIP